KKGLAGGVGGEGGYLFFFGVSGNGVGRIRRPGRDKKIDFAAQDQLGSAFRAPCPARLAFFANNLARKSLPAALQAFCHDRPDLIEDESVGFAESGQRAGTRTDMTDLDGP